MEEFANLKRVAVNELRQLNAKYANKDEFEPSDAKTYDCLMHGLKCHLTSEAMMEAAGEPSEGMSGRRGRAANGRYVSRDGMSSRQSYDEGYSHGYEDAMQRSKQEAMSGHWPAMPPYPRNW